MNIQSESSRKLRTRTLIQLGGLLQKSGLMDTFSIEQGEDLQSYNSRHKAIHLYGFLIESLETYSFDKNDFKRWLTLGRSYLEKEDTK